MPYIKIKLSNNGKKAFQTLKDALKISMSEAQKLIDKKRLFCDGKLVEKKNEILKGCVELIVYKNEPKGVEIVFENQDFAILEKESGVLSHPNGRHCQYSLCDEIWHLWGKNACVAHRLDKETSGLILIAKNKNSQSSLKKMFENKEIQKEYLALVFGQTQDEFRVNEAINLNNDYENFKMRMQICKEGKEAITEFKKLDFWKEFNASLLLCKPLTGRQHQIRLHLFHMKHKILGEYLYGLEKQEIESILDHMLSKEERVKLTGASRLLLHSQRLKFRFKNENFDISSKKDIKQEFLQSLKIAHKNFKN